MAELPENDLRHLRLTPPLEFRRAPGAAQGSIEGYGAAFDNVDLLNTRITKGAFTASLAEHRSAGTIPAMLWSHNDSKPIGRWTDMREDARGLLCRGELNMGSENGREAHAHLTAGDVTGLSVGFMPADDGIVFKDGVLTLRKLNLFEVSITAVPANLRARVTEVRSLASKRELEELLHGAGLARGAADRIAQGGWPALAGETEPHCIMCGGTKTDARTLIKGPACCICAACAEEIIILSGINETKAVDGLLTRLKRARVELRGLQR